uniref:Uncharacterized protein n=1 Tax=Triticum urartu TaxID=4572 RepID=A0A8R7R601_TRIUA
MTTNSYGFCMPRNAFPSLVNVKKYCLYCYCLMFCQILVTPQFLCTIWFCLTAILVFYISPMLHCAT